MGKPYPHPGPKWENPTHMRDLTNSCVTQVHICRGAHRPEPNVLHILLKMHRSSSKIIPNIPNSIMVATLGGAAGGPSLVAWEWKHVAWEFKYVAWDSSHVAWEHSDA